MNGQTKRPNDKERICIDIAIDPKGQGDLQGHMIFYMTPGNTLICVTKL